MQEIKVLCMNTFVKIGLPWVISIASVFYLGLKLGSHSQEKNNSISNNQTQKQDTKTIQSPQIPDTNLKEFPDREIVTVFRHPSFHPI